MYMNSIDSVFLLGQSLQLKCGYYALSKKRRTNG